MAMNLGGRRGGPVSEINVTPMADIMIVLLIIFMVATPAIVSGPVEDLPPARTAEQKQEDVIVWIQRDTTTYLGTRRLGTVGELLPRLQEQLEGRSPEKRIVYLKADENLPYAEVMKVMDLCREAGAEQVALMTAPRTRG